jgi:hypothetical protein
MRRWRSQWETVISYWLLLGIVAMLVWAAVS